MRNRITLPAAVAIALTGSAAHAQVRGTVPATTAPFTNTTPGVTGFAAPLPGPVTPGTVGANGLPLGTGAVPGTIVNGFSTGAAPGFNASGSGFVPATAPGFNSFGSSTAPGFNAFGSGVAPGLASGVVDPTTGALVDQSGALLNGFGTGMFNPFFNTGGAGFYNPYLPATSQVPLYNGTLGGPNGMAAAPRGIPTLGVNARGQGRWSSRNTSFSINGSEFSGDARNPVVARGTNVPNTIARVPATADVERTIAATGDPQSLPPSIEIRERVAGSREEIGGSSATIAGEVRTATANPKQIRLARRMEDIMAEHPIREGKVVKTGATGLLVRYEANGEFHTERYLPEQVFFFHSDGTLSTVASEPELVAPGDRVLIPQRTQSPREAVAGSREENRAGHSTTIIRERTTVQPSGSYDRMDGAGTGIRERVAGSREEVRSSVAGSRSTVRNRRPAR